MDISKNGEFDIEITDLSDEGLGIGKAGGFTWFVKDAVIGDSVRAAAVSVKKNYGYARLVHVNAPSPLRVNPPCKKALPCGGCQIQQMDYRAQLKFKESRVVNALRRIGGFEPGSYTLEPIAGMEYPFRYRNKAVYPVGKNREGRLVTGFYAGRTHSIIECGDCLIGVKENGTALKTILGFMEERRIDPYDEKAHRGVVRHVLIRKGFKSGELMVCLVINAERLKEGDGSAETELLKRLKKALPSLKSFSLCVNKKKTNVIMGERLINIYGPGFIEDTVGGVRFCISPLSFFQVNPVQMERLYDAALDMAGLTGRENVWDLYCGVGTISLYMASAAAKVYGVEIIPEAIENARENARVNGIKNAEFFAGKAEEVLPSWAMGTHEKIDVIVADPPRKGCDEKCLNTMLKLSPARIVYVSCNPATLARDLKILSAGGYTLEKVRPFDMFPHTVSTETVVSMSIKCAGSEPKSKLASDLGERRDTAQSLTDFVRKKPDTHINVSLDMDDYHRISGD